MAKIEEIDYDQIITKANQIANSANDMQQAIKEAFNKIQSMSENWFGQSYDNFINTVNMSVIGLNNIFEITVSDIPHEIAAKAKSYAASNQATVGVSLNEQIALILAELPKTNKGAKLRFKTEEVNANKAEIKAKFDEAVSNADNALSTTEALATDWRSISGDTNTSELKAAFGRLKNILNKLSGALEEQVNAQATTIEILENAANAVESTKDVVENIVDSATEAAEVAAAHIKQSAADVWTNLTGKN